MALNRAYVESLLEGVPLPATCRREGRCMAADRVRSALNAWPLVRQITHGDPRGLGKAVQSKRSAARGAEDRRAAVGGGAAVLAGELAMRWSVFKAGDASARDPRYTVEPQRARADERGTHAQER